MSRIAGFLGVAWLVIGSAAWSNGSEGPSPAPAVERLIEQLGDADYRVRDAASKALEALGPKVLPALRQARTHADPEIRRRLELLIPPLERAAILTPKRVSLNLVQQPIRAALAEISKQTGYKIDLYPEAQANGEREQLLYTFQFDDLPLWEALDRLCAAGNVGLPTGYPDGLQLQVGKGRSPFVCHDGLFRVAVQGANYRSSVDLANVPRQQPLGQRSENLDLTLRIDVEPRLSLIGVGRVQLTQALDECDNSLVPLQPGIVSTFVGDGSYRGFNLHASVNLASPCREAKRLKLVRGVVPVRLLIEQKPQIVVEQVLSAKGRKFQAAGVELDLEDIRAMNKGYVVQMLARQTAPLDGNYSWTSSLSLRVELEDDKGNKYHGPGGSTGTFGASAARCTFEYSHRGDGQLGPPAKLIYYSWTTMLCQVPFEFKDLPLP